MESPKQIILTAAGIAVIAVAAKIAYDEYILYRVKQELSSITFPKFQAQSAPQTTNRVQNAPVVSAAARLAEQQREQRASSTRGRELQRRCGELQQVASQLPPGSYAHQQADEACARHATYIQTGRVTPEATQSEIRRPN
jgi:hypothetical protein